MSTYLASFAVSGAMENNKWRRSFYLLPTWNSTVSVSYTHLDVYKRQAYNMTKSEGGQAELNRLGDTIKAMIEGWATKYNANQAQ